MGTINQFLVDAKIKSYASNAKYAKNWDGSKIFTYVDNDFKYVDECFSDNPFSGIEIVTKDSKRVFEMHYIGYFYENSGFEDQINKFLRQSLLQVPLNNPFRGPNKFHNDIFEYKNMVEFPTNNSFLGKELITVRGIPAYTGNYFGVFKSGVIDINR